MHLLDSKGYVLHANQACLDLLGLKAGDFIGQKLSKFLADANDLTTLLNQLNRGENIHARALTLLSAAGTKIQILLQANACMDGQVLEYGRLFMQDISGKTITDGPTQLKHDVLKVLAESATTQEAMEGLVPVMASALGCDIGLAWRADEKSNSLERLVFWRENSENDATHFLSKSNNISLVLSSGFPAALWFSDRVQVLTASPEPNQETNKETNKEAHPETYTETYKGWRCMGKEMSQCLPDYKQIFSVPIAIGRLNWGLMGFFARRETSIDAALITLLESLGREIGRFVERQNAFENYQKLQESYSLAIAGANDGIWDWDFKTNEAYFSPRWKSLLGYEDHELENHFDTFRSLTHPDDYPRIMDAVQRHMETREPYDEHIRMRTKTDTYIWISTRGQCSYDTKGQPVRMSGSHRDITDLKLAELARQHSEEKLLESQANFKQLAENIREVAWILSADLEKFIYISPAFEEYWEASCQDLYNDASIFFDGIVEEDRQRMLQLLDTGSSDRAELEIEFRLHKSQAQKPRWLWARMFPICDAESKAERYCGIAHDITSKKEVEKHVSEFYSTISHELRTPLTSIRAALGLIEGGLTGDISSETLEYTNIARDNCDRLIRLISDMLDIKKVEANHLELRLGRLHAAAIVQTTVESVRPYAEQSGVILKVEDCSGRDFLGDSDRVIQILTNLLSNAIKYTPPGKTVTISAEDCHGASKVKRPTNIRFSVRDQGPGISEKDKLDLFGPFQQLSCIENQVNRGTGLGLAISKVLVEKQNGTIGVNSRLGEGSEFWFELPTYEAEKVSEMALEQNNDQSGAMPKILLLEDSESIALILTAVLTKNGYSVARAATIAQARELILELDQLHSNPAIVIADVNLPDGSGLTFVNWLQDKKTIKHIIPAIVLSGSTPNLSEIKVRDAVDWVRKPFDNHKLLSLIKKRINTTASKEEAKARIYFVSPTYIGPI